MNKQVNLFGDQDFTQGQPTIKFSQSGTQLLKETKVGEFKGIQSLENVLDWDSDIPLSTRWTIEELNQKQSPKFNPKSLKNFKIVDLFCGTGGLSLGVKRGLQAVSINSEVSFACDISEPAAEVYKFNHRPKVFLRENVQNLLESNTIDQVDGEYTYNVRDTYLIPELEAIKGNVDVFLAGPPCEGNSNLNNKTRRSDPRNELYVLSVLIGIVLKSKIIIIENVPTVTSAKQNVVERSKLLLQRHGYDTRYSEYILAANQHLVGQTRKRHFIVAVKNPYAKTATSIDGLIFPDLPVKQIIRDKSQYNFNHAMLDVPSTLSDENQRRIEYLHDHDIYELPDSQRPDCHRLKPHSYPSVYGRMYPNEPAPTLSTGFLSPGRGRYTHPYEKRTITLREAARLQGFPTYYNWYPLGSEIGKTHIARLIGDAVPPNMGMTALLLGLSNYYDDK